MNNEKPPKKIKKTATQNRAARRTRQTERKKIYRWLIAIGVALVAILLVLGLVAPMLVGLLPG
jgi:t-SNARE complex subunit (syntaxin)